MGIRHVDYWLETYHRKLASVCPLFTSRQTGFVTFSAFTDGKKQSIRAMMETIGKHTDIDRFREMVISDAISVNIDRHSGNFGFLVDNETGAVTDFAPLFDHNLSQLPYLMEHDDAHRALDEQGPKIGYDFVEMARAVMTPEYKSVLVNLRDFDYQNPGLGCPQWKIDTLNRLKDETVNRILGTGKSYSAGTSRALPLDGLVDAQMEPQAQSAGRPLPASVEGMSEGEDPDAPFDIDG